MRFSEIVPTDDLDKLGVEFRPDDIQPPGGVKMIIGPINPISIPREIVPGVGTSVRTCKRRTRTGGFEGVQTTNSLVPSPFPDRPIMREKPRRYGGHIRFFLGWVPCARPRRPSHQLSLISPSCAGRGTRRNRSVVRTCRIKGRSSTVDVG
jgi:hypothetical protein